MWVALADCTLHARPGEVMERAVVVFRDGRITAILPPEGSGEAAKPARVPLGPRVIDAKGLHVYAAFIDACVEVDAPAPAGDESQRHWNARITPQRSALDGAGIDEGTASSLRRLGFGAAAVAPRGGIFRGRGALVSLAKPADDASAAKPLVYRDDVYQSVAMDAGGGGYPDSQMGSIAVIRQTLSDADWQFAQRERGTWNEPVNVLDYLAPSGGGSIPAGAVRPPSRPGVLLFNTESELDALRALRICDEFSRPRMLLGCGTEFRRLAPIAAAKTPYVLPLTFPKAPDVSSVAKQESTELRDMMTWEQAPTNPRRLKDAGVSFALSTIKLRDRGEFSKNLRAAIKHGLKEDDALASLTTIPASMLGASDLGTIEAGKRANLLVTDGPVFGKNADGKESRVRAVWIDGVAHEINAAPVSYEGVWDLSIPADQRPIPRRLEIGKENEVEVFRDGKQVKASKVEALPGRLSFMFDHDALDNQGGMTTVAALVSDASAGAPATMTGFGMTADGRRFEFIASKRPKSLAGVWPIIFDQPGTPTAVLVASKDGAAGLRDVPLADGVDPKSITLDKFSWDGANVRYEVDHAKFGGEGVIPVEASVDWVKSPPVLAGSMNFPDGKRVWKSIRRETNPFIGTWRVTEADGVAKDAAAKDGLTIRITAESVTLTFGKAEGEPTVVRCDDVKFAGLPIGDEFKDAPTGPIQLSFTHDLSKQGREGKSSDTITLAFAADGPDKDRLIGSGTLPDGSTHTYKAEKQSARGSADAEDDDSTADVPEKLTVPFGPYGYEEGTRPDPANTLFTNATIWTCGPKGRIARGYLWVKDGKVQALGEGDPAPGLGGEGVRTIDAMGKHLSPGMIDCHSHTGISGGVNEGGQAVTAEVRIQDVTNPDPVAWYQQLAGGTTAVNNLHGSANAIGGQSQTNKIRWGCPHPDDMHIEGAIPGIKFALGENPRRSNRGPGRDVGGAAAESRYPATRMGVEMLIRDRFTAAKEYAARSGARRDLELEALAEVLAGKRLVHCHSYRQDEMLMLALVARDFGFRIGTYQHALEGYKVADYVRDYSGGASGFTDWWAYKVEVQDAIPAAFPIMHEQGVVVSFNSDSNELARRMNTEAAKAVKYGPVTEEEALKFVTINPAKQLRIDHLTGSLEPGKDADVVLWSGSPLSAFTRCEATYVDGRELFSLAADAAAREKIKAERGRLIQKLLSEGKKKKADDASGRPEGAPAERPAGRGPGRRRPTEEEAQAAAVEAFYIELYESGRFGHTRGDCGCGWSHDR